MVLAENLFCEYYINNNKINNKLTAKFVHCNLQGPQFKI